jgi:fructokinase
MPLQNDKLIVVGLGEVLWDCLPSGKLAGGAPANFACTATGLGAAGAIASAVGEDADGRKLKATFADKGVNVAAIEEVPAPTSRVEVSLTESGSPSYRICEGVAWDALPWTAAMANLAANANAICFGTLGQRRPEARETIWRFLDHASPSCLKIFDVNLRQHYYDDACILASLERADVLKINDEELPVVAAVAGISDRGEAQLERLRRAYSLQTLILTKGRAGSTLVTTETVSERRAGKVECVDSVGAGDAFGAACTMGLLLDLPLDVVHHAATDLAAYVCTQRGATPTLPENLTNVFQQ